MKKRGLCSFWLITCFIANTTESINFNKTKEVTSFLFKNPTNSSYRIIVKKNNSVQKTILKPDGCLRLTQDKDNLIQHLIIGDTITHKPAHFFVNVNNAGEPTYTIQDKKCHFDQFKTDFDTALNHTGEYYKDAISGVDKKYPDNISSQWYKASLPNGVTPVAFINFIRSLYTKYFPVQSPRGAIKPDDITRIPKQLHQIWIGPKPIPEEYKKYQASWRSLHPKWHYKLWTNSDVATFNWSSPDIKKIFEKASNYATKADILRMEILNTYGGVYVDLDTEPFEALDSLTHTFDFFGLLYGPDKGTLVVDVFFLGAKPHHPIIEQTIKNIIALDRNPPNLSHLTKNKKFASIVTHAVMPLTYAVWQKADKTGNRDIILPLVYFSNYRISPVSYGVHYPQRSWLNA